MSLHGMRIEKNEVLEQIIISHTEKVSIGQKYLPDVDLERFMHELIKRRRRRINQ